MGNLHQAKAEEKEFKVMKSFNGRQLSSFYYIPSLHCTFFLTEIF